MRNSDPLGVGLVTCSLIGLMGVGAYLYAPSLRAFLGFPSNDVVYSLCVSQVAAGAGQATDPLARAMLSGMSSGVCQKLRETCEKSPSGRECEQIKQAVVRIARN